MAVEEKSIGNPWSSRSIENCIKIFHNFSVSEIQLWDWLLEGSWTKRSRREKTNATSVCGMGWHGATRRSRWHPQGGKGVLGEPSPRRAPQLRARVWCCATGSLDAKASVDCMDALCHDHSFSRFLVWERAWCEEEGTGGARDSNRERDNMAASGDGRIWDASGTHRVSLPSFHEYFWPHRYEGRSFALSDLRAVNLGWVNGCKFVEVLCDHSFAVIYVLHLEAI